MSLLSRRPYWFLICVAVLAMVTALLLPRRTEPAASGPRPPGKPAGQSIPTAPPDREPALSLLAEIPDWPALEIYQNTITRADFERLLTTVFTTGEAWKNLIRMDDSGVEIQTGAPSDPTFRLSFAPPDTTTAAPRTWHTAAELPPAPPGRPLEGLRIAIDPGHIGGEWAKMEERWLVIHDAAPVCEGDMTLLVANLLKPKLEALGATVLLVREKTEPVTTLRPEDLQGLARESSPPGTSPDAIRRAAEKLFYRTAEIRARAELVNKTLKPDLVLCLHFNAEPWGDPLNPVLVDRTHFHLLLNGAYTDDEVVLADQRFAMLRKLLQRTHQEEALVGETLAGAFAQTNGLPPYLYPVTSTNSRPVDNNHYLWARNLLANRLYDCPVIYTEPYVMNSSIDFPRLQAGDYDGLREINGKSQPSIFREYADAIVLGLSRHYTAARQ